MHDNTISIDKNRKKQKNICYLFFVFHVDIIHLLCKSAVFEGDLLLEKVEFFYLLMCFILINTKKNMHFLSGKWSARSVQEKYHPSEFSARHVIRGGLEIIGKK